MPGRLRINQLQIKCNIFLTKSKPLYTKCNIFFTYWRCLKMIIAKPEWFKRRKYGGWGLGIKTWQGAVYFAVMIIALVVLITIAGESTHMKLIITGIWLAFLLVDVFDIMWKLKKDEREVIHEAIAERNAAWGMMIVLCFGVFVELLYSTLNNKVYVNPFVVGALAVGVVIKSITNYKLEREN